MNKPQTQNKFLGLQIHYGYIIMFMGMLVIMCVIGFARMGYTMILPFMQHDLNLSLTEMGFLATGNLIGYMSIAVLGGMLASKYRPRIVIICSLFIVGLAIFFTGLAQGFALALLMRIITGIGGAGANMPIMGLASAWFAPQKRGMATGVMVGGTGVSILLAGLILPRIFNYFGDIGWRVGWFFLGGTVLVVALLSIKILYNSPQERGLLPVGGTSENGVKENNQPLQWSIIYRSKTIWHLGLIYFLYGFSYMIYSTFFVSYLVDERGMLDTAAGNLWSIVGVLSIFSGVIWGLFSDRFGRKNSLVVVFVMQAVAFFIFSRPADSGLYLFSVLLFGICAWSVPGIMAAASADHLGSRMASAALGIITMVFGVGQALGPAVSGYLTDVTSSYVLAFVIATVGSLLAAAASFFLKLGSSAEAVD